MHMLSSQSCAQPEPYSQTQTHSHTLPRSPLESQCTMSCWEWGLLLALDSCVFVCPLLQVTYDLTGSLDKNKDVLPQNILFVMKSKDWGVLCSSHPLYRQKTHHGNSSSHQNSLVTIVIVTVIKEKEITGDHLFIHYHTKVWGLQDEKKYNNNNK